MLRNPLQKIVFGSLMALAMVYGMEVYNAALRQGGLSGSCFQIPVLELVGLGAIVLVVESLIGGPLARKLAAKVVAMWAGHPVLALSVCMVCAMCPMMSFVAVLFFKGMDKDVAFTWLRTVAFNFPMALGWQLLVAGPLVRFLFRRLFPLQPQGL